MFTFEDLAKLKDKSEYMGYSPAHFDVYYNEEFDICFKFVSSGHYAYLYPIRDVSFTGNGKDLKHPVAFVLNAVVKLEKRV